MNNNDLLGLTIKIKVKKSKLKLIAKRPNLFEKLPTECLNIINDFLQLKDDFITYKRYFINNLNVALTNKYLYNIFLIKNENIKELSKQEEYTEITKTIAKQNYGLNDKELEGLEYTEKRHSVYRNTVMKIYNLTDIMNCAFLKHGSHFTYKNNQTIKKEKREVKKNEKEAKLKKEKMEMNMETEKRENERKEQVNNLVIVLDKNNVKYNFHEIENLVITDIDKSYQKLVSLATRRTELKKRLDQSGIEYDVKNDVELRIFTDVDGAFQYTYDNYISENTKSVRKNELSERLKQHGLYIRNDSLLCSNYIDYGTGNLDDVVNTMVEMDFFYKYTSYPGIYKSKLNEWFREQRDFDGEYYHELDDESRIELSNAAKRCALIHWVYQYIRKMKDEPLTCPHLPASLRDKVARERAKFSR